MFGLLIKSMFTHCISYFPDAMINQHNQKQFKKGFFLSLGARGIESIMARKALQQEQKGV